MIPIEQRKPEELFDKKQAQEYDKRLETLWLELVRANDSMYVIDRVLKFPAHLLLAPQYQTFFPLLVRNFVDTVVLVVTNALSPGSSGTLTLLSLQRWIQANCRWVVRCEMQAYLEELAISDEARRLENRAKKLRNEVVAHLDRKHVLDPSEKVQLWLSFEEFRALLKETNNLREGLCFGNGRSDLHLSYSPLLRHPKGIDPRSDIEYLLDLLAAASHVLRLPEKEPHLWPGFVRNLSEEDREAFNQWRCRINLQRVPFE